VSANDRLNRGADLLHRIGFSAMLPLGSEKCMGAWLLFRFRCQFYRATVHSLKILGTDLHRH
jgi:hypothetical protein